MVMKGTDEQGRTPDRLFWAIRDQPPPKNGPGHPVLYPFATPELSLDEKGSTLDSFENAPVAMRQDANNRKKVTLFSDCAGPKDQVPAYTRASPLPACFTCDGGFEREGSAGVPASCRVEQLSAHERYDFAAIMGVGNDSSSSSDVPSFMPMTTAEQRWMWREFLHETVARTQVTDLYNHFDVEADPPSYKRPPPSCRTLATSFPETAAPSEPGHRTEIHRQEEPVSVPLLVGDAGDEVLDDGEPPVPVTPQTPPKGPNLPGVQEEDVEALDAAGPDSPQSRCDPMPMATYADVSPFSVPEAESFQEGTA
mmetsp:Transcript_26909/g.62067  ORF Transcript_26909/g.62067 Transcript_26909/m.62067 type:complete len:310 (-) Transcript_26909:26-955(-)